MARSPLSEVFGFRPDDMSPEAQRYRNNRLCPFFNKVPNCTKDKAEDPLGTCSIYGGADDSEVIVTCPVRFREDWLIATDAAEFFFPPRAQFTTLTEVRLADKYGKSAGNIDLILVQIDEAGDIIDYGAVEVQAVYISGNVRKPFAAYMKNPQINAKLDWSQARDYPRADYLSSSRKRLAPQLIFKGGILHTWGRKTAVALNTGFYNTLPALPECPKAEAEIAWLIYDLILGNDNRYHLQPHKTVYTRFEESLERITRTEAGDEGLFIRTLKTKLSRTRAAPDEGTPPDNKTVNIGEAPTIPNDVNEADEVFE